MVHQRVPVEDALPHLDDVQVVVSQRHPVPEHAAVTRLVCFPVAILTNHVLHRVQLATTVVCVDDDLLPPDHLLLATVHNVVA